MGSFRNFDIFSAEYFMFFGYVNYYYDTKEFDKKLESISDLLIMN